MTEITQLAALLTVVADKKAVLVIEAMIARLRALDLEPQDAKLLDEFETSFMWN